MQQLFDNFGGNQYSHVSAIDADEFFRSNEQTMETSTCQPERGILSGQSGVLQPFRHPFSSTGSAFIGVENSQDRTQSQLSGETFEFSQDERDVASSGYLLGEEGTGMGDYSYQDESQGSISQTTEGSCTGEPEEPRAGGDEEPRARGADHTTRSHAWFCTFHNYTIGSTSKPDKVIQRARTTPFFGKKLAAFSYLVGQRELGGKSGTLHGHCYIYFPDKCRFNPLRKWLLKVFECKDVNIAVAQGKPSQARDYCTKSDTQVSNTTFEYGSLPKAGSRTDLTEVADAITEGASTTELATRFPTQFIKFHRGIQALIAATRIVPRDPTVECDVYWWFGPTGVGKSRMAFETYPDAYVKMGGNKWWCGYEGEKTVIMDDYRAGAIPFSETLRQLDRYAHRVEAKGYSLHLSATRFVITTNMRPEEIWHRRSEEDKDQLLRRIKQILFFKTPDKPGEMSYDILKDDEKGIVYTPLSKEEMDIRFPPEAQPAIRF